MAAQAEQVEDAIKTLRSIQPDLDRETRALDRFDAAPGMWLVLGVDDLEADALMIKRFGGSGGVALESVAPDTRPRN